MIITRKAPTKVIFCGEHFVVYGAPAIAFSTNLHNEVRLSEEKGEGPLSPARFLASEKGADFRRSGNTAGEHSFRSGGMMPLSARAESGRGPFPLGRKEGFEIISKERRKWASADGKANGGQMLENYLQLFWRIAGKIKKGRKLKAKFFNRGAIKGMGNSASFATALARCLLKYSKRKMTDDELFNLVQETETRMHGGRASGIDARTVIVGRPQIFMKRFNPLRYTFADADACLPKGTVLIVVDTYKGSRESTAETTARFARAQGILKRPEELSDEERRKLLEAYGKVFKKILGELKADGDVERLHAAV